MGAEDRTEAKDTEGATEAEVEAQKILIKRINKKMRATIVCVLAFMLAYAEGSTELLIRTGAMRHRTGAMNELKDTRLAAAQARLFHKRNQAQVKANKVAQEPVVKSKIIKCNLDSDCPGAQQCVNYAQKLSALARSVDASAEQSAALYWKTKAHIKRCKDTSFPKMPIETIEEQMQFQMIMDKSITTIKETYVKLNKTGFNMSLPTNLDKIDQIIMDSAKFYNELTGNVETPEGKTPIIKTAEVSVAAAPALDMNTFLLISLLDKDDASSSTLDKLLPIILMSQGGTGMGGDLLSNPLLLMTLLDDDKSGSSDLLLIMTLMNSGGLGGSTDLLSSPLLLLTLLKDDNSMTDLLPILLLSGGLGGGVAGTGRSATGGVDMMSNPLILLLLLDDNNNSSLTKLLPILLMGSMGASGMGAGAGINGILPLILLLDDNTTEISDLLLIMMASGGALGGSGGAAGGDLSALLPILLLGDGLGGGLNSTKDLLLFSLLGSGGLGGTGGAAGGLGGILPLLLLTNSSILNGSDSLLMILLLSGGLGGAAGGAGALDMNMLLPLILKDSLNDTKDLLLIMMMGGMGGAGGAGALGSMLPLLLLGNGTLDTTTLVLVMMMSQAQPGTVTPGTGGITIGDGSGLNSILPLLLKDSGSDDTLTTLLLVNMLSQGAASATSGGL